MLDYIRIHLILSPSLKSTVFLALSSPIYIFQINTTYYSPSIQVLYVVWIYQWTLDQTPEHLS